MEDTLNYIEDKDWIKILGDIHYMQYPDENPYYPSDKKISYGWLMQFADETRIDLLNCTVRKLHTTAHSG